MARVVRGEQALEEWRGDGWVATKLADHRLMREPAMELRRLRLDPHVHGTEEAGTERERFLYVVRGSGEARVEDRTFHLEPESVLWLEPGDRFVLRSGSEGLELLESTAPGH